MSLPDLPNESLPTVEEEAAARARFLLLFAEPYRILEEFGDGHGAYVALSIGLFLCERYFRHKSDSLEAWREERLLAEAARHFNADYDFFREFWGIYRHGMLSQGVPRETADFGWDMGEDFAHAPTKAFAKGRAVICLNPWRFTEEMIVLCWSDPAALTRICSVPLGPVHNVKSSP